MSKVRFKASFTKKEYNILIAALESHATVIRCSTCLGIYSREDVESLSAKFETFIPIKKVRKHKAKKRI